MSEITKEQAEQIIAISKEGQTALQAVQDSVGGMQERQVKIETDLEEVLTSNKTALENVEVGLAEIRAAQEEQTRSVFDVVLKEPKIYQLHGYSDPVTRALYRSQTEWTRAKGWHRNGESYEVAKDVANMNDALYLYAMFKSLNSAMKGEPTSYYNTVTGIDSYKLFSYELAEKPHLKRALDNWPEHQKALSTTGVGTGAEFVPTQLSNQLIDDIRLALRVAGLFPNLTVPMGVGTMDVPKRGARQAAYLTGEPTTDSPSKVGTATPPTGKASFSMITHALRMLWSDDITEDSAIAMFPLVREELIQAISDAAETAILNGDIDSTHMDSDVTAGTDVNKSYYGLRYFSGNSAGEAAVNISTLSTANLRAIRKAMGRFGVNPSDLAWLTGISGYVQMLGLTEVLTMDKWGPGFTAKAGTLAMFDGAPVVVSEFIRQDLNASGVYDGTTMTKTEILLANTKAHWTGDKAGGMKMETARDIESLQNVAVASRRNDFERVNVPGSDEASVGIGYNLTSG
jgi:HK97 family phage major capsid protein